MQTTGDTETFILYLTHLTKQLEIEDKEFRDNTVVLIDGAPGHTADETRDHIKILGLPVMLTAPYSWDAAPCELWFSQFKAIELNPENLGTGKR